MRRPAFLLAGGAGTSTVVAAALALSAAGDACAQAPGTVAPKADCPGSPPAPAATPTPVASQPAACVTTTLLRGVAASGARRGVRVRFTRSSRTKVSTSIFQSATRRVVLGERLVFRSRAGKTVRWSGRRQAKRRAPRDGIFFVRVKATRSGDTDVRRLALRRTGGRFVRERTFAKRDGCGAVRSFKLERPAFGGRANRAVSVSFRLASSTRARLELLRGGKRVRVLSDATRSRGILHRVRLDSKGLRRGRYEVRLRVGSATTTLSLRKV